MKTRATLLLVFGLAPGMPVGAEVFRCPANAIDGYEGAGRQAVEAMKLALGWYWGSVELGDPVRVGLGDRKLVVYVRRHPVREPGGSGPIYVDSNLASHELPFRRWKYAHGDTDPRVMLARLARKLPDEVSWRDLPGRLRQQITDALETASFLFHPNVFSGEGPRIELERLPRGFGVAVLDSAGETVVGVRRYPGGKKRDPEIGGENPCWGTSGPKMRADGTPACVDWEPPPVE